jgi:hypothetical protein
MYRARTLTGVVAGLMEPGTGAPGEVAVVVALV